MLPFKKLLSLAGRHGRWNLSRILSPATIAARAPRCAVYRSRHEYLPPTDALVYESYDELSNEYLGIIAGGHRVFVVQPYIKWGPRKITITTPELQMAEAVALIQTLPHWTVVDKTLVPLLSLDKKKLLGSGGLDKLRSRVRGNRNVTAVFVSANVLKPVQVSELQAALGVPVYDRYAIVIHIFRAHAQSREAKLQVALAEIPYIRKKLLVADQRSDGAINIVESRKRVLQNQEQKLKEELTKLRQHRQQLRSQRKHLSIPSVAVVGYTNSGKTSLIKALTGDATMEPRNQLFATLDSTAHEGLLPSRLKVLYMDTIGFIQDVPETLIEPFVATLEDAIEADVVVHVYDASHPDRKAQVEHVENTIKSLIDEKRPVIVVANKCDLVAKGGVPEDIIAVSAAKETGIDLLRNVIEKELLKATGRKTVKVRVESGSEAAAWLYKETAVIDAQPDPNDNQYMFLSVITTELTLIKFKKYLQQ